MAEFNPDYTIEGKKRRRFGSEEHWTWLADDTRCPDCSCRWGEFHAEGCDIEECPVCNSQRLTCRHVVEGKANPQPDGEKP